MIISSGLDIRCQKGRGKGGGFLLTNKSQNYFFKAMYMVGLEDCRGEQSVQAPAVLRKEVICEGEGAFQEF